MDDNLPERYALLYIEIAEDEAKLDDKKKQYAAMERDMLAWLEKNSIVNVKNSHGTVFLERKTWSRVVDGTPEEQIRAAFRLMGWEAMLKPTCNVQSLSAAVRNEENEERPLPPEVAAILKTAEVFKVKVRRS